MDHKKTAPVDIIAAARSMIEPLTGYTLGPWWTSGKYSGREMGCSIIAVNPSAGPAPGNPTRGQVAFATAALNTEARQCERNARLIAAAPDLPDMVATLADELEAERAENQRIREAVTASGKLGQIIGFLEGDDGRTSAFLECCGPDLINRARTALRSTEASHDD